MTTDCVAEEEQGRKEEGKEESVCVWGGGEQVRIIQRYVIVYEQKRKENEE